MTAMYLEHYLDSLESLPVELSRNFSLMRELDLQAQDILSQIDDSTDEYMRSSKYLTPMEKTKRVGDISKQFTKCKEYGDDKVSLAMQTYDLVDKHIRKLDADLARFEADLRERAHGRKNLGESRSNDDGMSRKGGKRKTGPADIKKIKGLKRKEAEEAEESKGRKKTKAGGFSGNAMGSGSTSTGSEAMDSVPLSLNFVPMSVGASDVLDMPVDPNEPTYCVCHQVSYGEMIGCDNLECPIEWFHFGCVGLTSKPKGKWFCPRCSTDRKKK